MRSVLLHRSEPARLHLKSPEAMDIGPGRVEATLGFLRAMRRAVIDSCLDIVIDLRALKAITPAATLLLAAEIERCGSARPGSVVGYEPESVDVQNVLAAMGFHDAVQAAHPASFEEWEGVSRIQSGFMNQADLALKCGQVAALARDVWSDPNFCDRVHAALNEAMTNVIMHAYGESVSTDEHTSKLGRWWIAAFSDPDRKHVWFMALDHGVTIPVSAPARNFGVRSYLAELRRPSDKQILWAVVADEGRSRTGLAQHGKGIPSMISLIKDRAEEGAVWIMSGEGAFYLEKRRATGPFPSRIYGVASELPIALPGTLILWKVGTPIIPPTEAAAA